MRKKLLRIEHVLIVKVYFERRKMRKFSRHTGKISFESHFRKRLSKENFLVCHCLNVRSHYGLEQSEGDRNDCQSVRGDCLMPGYALQTCKRSVVHDGFELRQVTFHKLATDNLGLQLQRQSLDCHAYCQVIPKNLFFSQKNNSKATNNKPGIQRVQACTR